MPVLRFRLPELDPVSFRIERPSEAAEFVVVDLVIDINPGIAKLSEHRVEITDAVRSLIRRGDDHQLLSQISTGKAEGMMTMENVRVVVYRG